MNTDETAITHEGQTYTARFFVKGGMVHLVSALGNKSTQVGSSPPSVLAKMMLREMVQDHGRKRSS